MRHLLGGRKGNFFIRGVEVVGRACGMLSIRGPQVSLGSPMVSTRRAQSPAPHTPPLPAPDASTKVHLKDIWLKSYFTLEQCFGIFF
jgi:hypothetical protein